MVPVLALLQDLDCDTLVPCLVFDDEETTYILTLTGMFTAPELANEKGSMIHLMILKENGGSCSATSRYDVVGRDVTCNLQTRLN
jgi:hypothetical protein